MGFNLQVLIPFISQHIKVVFGINDLNRVVQKENNNKNTLFIVKKNK